jgi:NADPH:quinone reductase-like Zn-dependent oxidoreductase
VPFRLALGRGRNPKYGAFQLYPIAYEHTTSPIPDSLSYEQAVVLPLAISTAAAGLYQKGFLELPYPTTDTKPSGKTILIWGGSSSVGSSTIQLAIASGLTVVSTAAKKNIEFVKSLGAAHVFDHADSKVVEDILKVLKGTDYVGAYDAVSLPETVKASVDITYQLGGGKVATVLSYAGALPSGVTTIGGKCKTRFSSVVINRLTFAL